MADSDSIKLCECGCGQAAPIATITNTARGYVAGVPHRFVAGHNIRVDPPKRRHSIHGMTGTPEFKAWSSMIERCTSPTHRSWANYGSRGICVCPRWLQSFQNFFDDMGPRPSRLHSLDRRDNDGDYEPGNCRWATDSVQKNNKRNNVRITHNGKTQTLSQWARELGLPPGLLVQRYGRGQRQPKLLSPRRKYEKNS